MEHIFAIVEVDFPIVFCNYFLSIKVVSLVIYQLAYVVFSILLRLSFILYFKDYVISKV